MADILQVVSDLLAMANTYLGIMPDKPDQCIGLFQYSSSPPEHSFGGTDYVYNVQARCRAAKATDAYLLAVQVQGKLNRYDDADWSILQATPILDIGQDAANQPRYEYTVNFAVAEK